MKPEDEKTGKGTVIHRQIHDTFSYGIVYIYVIPDKSHEGRVKIGSTTYGGSIEDPHNLTSAEQERIEQAARDRIDEQTKTADIKYYLKYACISITKDAVEVFVKLPKQFYIETPMGHYNPDWAVAFHDDAGVKHIYFVAETKGVSEGQLDVGVKGIEKAKIECARKHFAKISDGDCIYGVCNSYAKLPELVKA